MFFVIDGDKIAQHENKEAAEESCKVLAARGYLEGRTNPVYICEVIGGIERPKEKHQMNVA